MEDKSFGQTRAEHIELQVKSNRFQETNVASIDCKLSGALNYNNLQQDRRDIIIDNTSLGSIYVSLPFERLWTIPKVQGSSLCVSNLQPNSPDSYL